MEGIPYKYFEFSFWLDEINSTRLSVSNIASGLYFIEVEILSTNERVVEKVVVLE